MMRTWLLVPLLAVCVPVSANKIDVSRKVTVVRVPGGGIQPQIAVDEAGAVHMIYYQGDPQNGDLYYVRSRDGGTIFSAPLRVNSSIWNRMRSTCSMTSLEPSACAFSNKASSSPDCSVY